MATATDLGVNGTGILQPLLKNRWRITFLGFAGDSDPLTVQAISAERPKIEFTEIQLHRYNSVAYIPGKYMFQPLNLVFETDTGGTVSTSLQAQLELQQQLIANVPAPRLPAAIGGAVFKFAIQLDSLDGNDRALETWIYEGCWLMTYDGGELDYTVEGETVKYNLVVRYDIARQIVDGVAVKATGGVAGLSL